MSRTRWEQAGDAVSGYSQTFGRLVAEGADVDGEARLADALLPRHGSVLDAGSGMGRVAAALAARGHRVTAIEPDPALVRQSRETYPDLSVEQVDILGYSPSSPGFDLIVAVGNVMVFLAEGSEREVLSHLRGMLGETGRILVGFHPVDGPATARDYPVEEFVADAAAAGLGVDLHAGTYELHPPSDDYAVLVLSPAKG